MAVNRHLGAVCALSLFFACSAGPSTTSPPVPAQAPTATPPKESPMTPRLETLDAQLLRECVEMGGSVALVRVREVRASQQGTRGARVRIEFELEQALHGSIPRQAGFWSFGGPATAQVGQRLIIALKPAPADAKDVGLLAFVPVPEGQEAEAARLHQEALASAGR
jgi:hypothetical protein